MSPNNPPPGWRKANTRSLDLHVHPHRDGAMSLAERAMVVIFLQRYAVWCGRARRHQQARGAVELLAEVAAGCNLFGRE